MQYVALIRAIMEVVSNISGYLRDQALVKLGTKKAQAKAQANLLDRIEHANKINNIDPDDIDDSILR